MGVWPWGGAGSRKVISGYNCPTFWLIGCRHRDSLSEGADDDGGDGGRGRTGPLRSSRCLIPLFPDLVLTSVAEPEPVEPKLF